MIRGVVLVLGKNNSLRWHKMSHSKWDRPYRSFLSTQTWGQHSCYCDPWRYNLYDLSCPHNLVFWLNRCSGHNSFLPGNCSGLNYNSALHARLGELKKINFWKKHPWFEKELFLAGKTCLSCFACIGYAEKIDSGWCNIPHHDVLCQRLPPVILLLYLCVHLWQRTSAASMNPVSISDMVINVTALINDQNVPRYMSYR